MFPGDSWETASGSELFADSLVFHNGDTCQVAFDLACLLRPLQQQSGSPPPLGLTPPAEVAHRRRSQSAFEAEFSGTSIEQQLVNCGEVTDSAFYARWLHVKAGGLAEAKQAILDHCKWREETTPGGIKDADISNELAADKVFLPGADCQGRPVILVLACRHQMRHRNLDETVRLIIYTLDNSAAIADTAINTLGQTLCVIDLSGLRMGNLDVEGLKALFDLLQRHYPERLAELWFLKAPFIFWGLWRIVSPFLAEGTRCKIRFMSGFNELQNSMSPEVLPERYGGQARLVSIAESVAARRAGEAAAAHRQAQMQEAAQAAMATTAGRMITIRISAASSTVKRWGAAGFGFLAAKAAAAGRQTARPFSAVMAAYGKRQAATSLGDSVASPALSRQLSANLDAAKAKARSIGAGMQHANRLVAEYALDGKGHMSKLLHLPAIVVCMLHKARLALKWAWGHAVRLARHPDSLGHDYQLRDLKAVQPAPQRVAASARLTVPSSAFASESQQSATVEPTQSRPASPLHDGTRDLPAEPARPQSHPAAASNGTVCAHVNVASKDIAAAEAKGLLGHNATHSPKTSGPRLPRQSSFSEIQPCPRECKSGAASATIPEKLVRQAGTCQPPAASLGRHLGATLSPSKITNLPDAHKPPAGLHDGQLRASGKMSRQTKDIIADSAAVGNKLPPALFQPVSTLELGMLWSRCRDVAGCAGQT